jgi:hypothetical protein
MVVMTVGSEPGKCAAAANDVTGRLADEFSEAADAARHAGQAELARHLVDRAEVFRWATSQRRLDPAAQG